MGERKNKDWYVTLEKEVSKKVVELFFEECGLQMLSAYQEHDDWCLNHDEESVDGGVFDTINRKEFKLPTQWKEAKEYICEEGKKDLEVGKWYKFDSKHFSFKEVVGRFSRIKDNSIVLNDHILDEKKYKEEDWLNIEHKHLAIELTHEELKEHLIACATARGFKKGVRIASIKRKDLNAGESVSSTIRNSYFSLSNNVLETVLLMGGWSVWSNSGGWAEIIKNELPEINGHKGEFTNDLTCQDFVKYGCVEFKIEMLSNILAYKDQLGNRSVKSITLDSGVTITMKQIEQIIKAHKNLIK